MGDAGTTTGWRRLDPATELSMLVKRAVQVQRVGTLRSTAFAQQAYTLTSVRYAYICTILFQLYGLKFNRQFGILVQYGM